MLGIIELDRGCRTIAAGHFQRKGTARNGDDASPRLCRKRSQERPKKPNANNGHGLARSNRAAAKDIHSAAKGLAREWYPL
jgi:hypothetical protein